MSCARDQTNGVNDACRRTFLRQWPIVAYRFVLGVPAIEEDELTVVAPDDYGALQLKQRAAYEWAVDKATHVFVSFTDTYIHIPNLLRCGYVDHDYFGLQVKHGDSHLSGGNGYWLSRRAMEAILKATPIGGKQGDEADWEILTTAGIKTVTDDRFGTTITRHLSKSTGNYDPADMFKTHKELCDE